MNKLSVIIPTLKKNMQLLNNLIVTLSKDVCVDEIIVIDNSCDGFETDDSKVKVIMPSENLFVNESWNLGVKVARNNIIALLNDDITIPENFCGTVLRQFPKDAGCLGIGIDSVKITKSVLPTTDSCNEIYLEEIKVMDLHWGICIFLDKTFFVEIPKELKIYCGDDWIIYQTQKQGKKVYQILGQDIYHYGSLSCSSSKFCNICKSDKKAFKKLTEKRWQNLFSISSSPKKYKVNFLGVRFTFNKRNN